MVGTRFVQILRVEDFRIESGTEARSGARGAIEVANVVRVWLLGQPTAPHATVTHAFLEARSDWQEPAPPRYDFQRKRILISYTIPAIQPVVSMLLDGVQLYCQYRELEGGAIHADVHLPRRQPGSTHEDPHWVPSD